MCAWRCWRCCHHTTGHAWSLLLLLLLLLLLAFDTQHTACPAHLVLRLRLLQLLAQLMCALRALPQLSLQLAAALLPAGQLLRQLLNLRHACTMPGTEHAGQTQNLLSSLLSSKLNGLLRGADGAGGTCPAAMRE
jgi:hypothetical protein